MRKTILLYGIALATLTALLKFIEYRFWLRDISLEFYLGAVALLFTALGVWAGLKLTRRKVVLITPGFALDESLLERLGMSKREHEVLELMAQGLSNKEIADKLFISPNTVKTHSSNLFVKLGVRRRAEAIRRAQELRLLP